MNNYVVLSDLHLSHKFSQKIYLNLVEIINEFEYVIINGDFWDDSKTTFKKFINSEWNQLFPLLKKKNTVYVYGNHDPEYHCNENVSLFSDKQVNSMFFEQSGRKFYITHGQELSFVTRMSMNIARINPMILRFIGLPIHGPLVIAQRLAESNSPWYERIKRVNSSFKNRIEEDTILIMGHTHVPELDLKNNYINTGFVNEQVLFYLILGEKISLMKKSLV